MNSIIQWNINESNLRLESIKLIIKRCNYSVLCTQKTNFKKDCSSILIIPAVTKRINQSAIQD